MTGLVLTYSLLRGGRCLDPAEYSLGIDDLSVFYSFVAVRSPFESTMHCGVTCILKVGCADIFKTAKGVLPLRLKSCVPCDR